MGNSVRFPTAATVPQGAVLSAAADQDLSGGHMNAAGPMSSAAETLVAMKAKAAKMDETETMTRF